MKLMKNGKKLLRMKKKILKIDTFAKKRGTKFALSSQLIVYYPKSHYLWAQSRKGNRSLEQRGNEHNSA